MAREPSLLQRIVSVRRFVQIGVGVGLWVLVSRYDLSLWWVILGGSLSGVVLGKFFCRWMCPLGAVMETIMGSANHGGMYQYFKVGCPIAWAGGLLNKVSLLRPAKTGDACAACGKCDEACYIVQHNPDYSLYLPDKANPGTHFACSRCLKCVESCPLKTVNLGTPLS